MWTGKLKMYKGTVCMNLLGDRGIFGSKATDKEFICGLEPNLVYNSVVWLTERNDETAKKALIAYEELIIAVLQNKIDGHRHKVDILNGAKL
jgi:hypothetical protein